jgi:hypothetical protein
MIVPEMGAIPLWITYETDHPNALINLLNPRPFTAVTGVRIPVGTPVQVAISRYWPLRKCIIFDTFRAVT